MEKTLKQASSITNLFDDGGLGQLGGVRLGFAIESLWAGSVIGVGVHGCGSRGRWEERARRVLHGATGSDPAATPGHQLSGRPVHTHQRQTTAAADKMARDGQIV